MLKFRKMSSKLIYILFLSIVIIGCSKSNDSLPENNYPRTFEDIENDFKAFQFEPGVNYFYVQSYGYENARYYNFEIILPSVENSEIRPLIVYFPSPDLENNNGEYSFVYTRCLLETLTESMEAVVLILDSWYLDFFTDKSKDELMKITMIELATKFLSVDSSKVLLMGFGYGADDSLYFVENHPELFSAAIPIASNTNTIFSSSEINRINLPIYLIFGEYQFSQSEPTLEQMELFVQQINNLGSNITLIVAPTVGVKQCDYVPYLKNGMEWLQTKIWNQ